MAEGERHHRGHGPTFLTRRRVLLGFIAAVAALAVTPELHAGGPEPGAPSQSQAEPDPSGVLSTPSSTSPPGPPGATEIGYDSPGRPEVIFGDHPASGTFALTFDDGTSATCAAEIVAGVAASGIHATFCPNGYMGRDVWDAQGEIIAAMAARGQVSICNHTWDHKDLTTLSRTQIEAELLRNEEWIQRQFGVSSRPFFRPPYGAHDPRVDDIAGNIGFTKVILWNGTFGDSIVHPPAFILQQLQEYLKGGTIMLGHANHPATASVIDDIIAQVRLSGLRPVTLMEMLGLDPNPALARSDIPNLILNHRDAVRTDI
jgi:peptidoglycan-N-acetylglucosamine deacetylase